MADGITVKLEGVDEINRVMADAAKQIRTKAVRSSLRKAANVINKQARQMAPVMSAPTKTRNVGTVQKNIVVRNSKIARRAGNEGVFIGVRPLKGSRQKTLGKASAKNPNDPFYWRFLEFGTKKMPARDVHGKNKKGFLRPAAESKSDEAIRTFMSSVIPQIEKLNNKAGR